MLYKFLTVVLRKVFVNYSPLYFFFFFFGFSFIAVLCYIFAVFRLWEQFYRKKKIYIKISCEVNFMSFFLSFVLFNFFYQMEPTLVQH